MLERKGVASASEWWVRINLRFGGIGRLETKIPGWGSGGGLEGGVEDGLLGGYFSEQGSEGERGGLGDDPVSE